MNVSEYCSVRTRLKSISNRVIDDSITFVTLSIAICILVGVFMMMILTSCSESSEDKKKESRQMAVESLKLITGNPESLNIIAISEMDSVFGNNFFSEDELIGILNNLSTFNSEITGSESTIDLDNPKKTARMERGMRLSDIIGNMITNSTASSAELTGWKLRVLYESLDQFNDTVRSERYFIFDKDLKYILHSFEIPIL